MFLSFSPPRVWQRNLTAYLLGCARRESKVLGDGFCLLRSVSKCLKYEYGIAVTLEDMQRSILKHVESSLETYKPFFQGSKDEMLAQLLHFLDTGNYNQEVCDMLPLITSRAMGINLRIYLRGSQHGVRLERQGDMLGARVIHVKLEKEHYTALVPKGAVSDVEEPQEVQEQEEEDSSSVYCTPCASPQASQSSVQSKVSDTTNTTQDSYLADTIRVLEHLEEPDNNYLEPFFGRGKPFPFHLFREAPVISVESTPLEIDGTVVYVVDNCPAHLWNEKAFDLRHFDMVTCRVKGFHGKRKIGKCLGSFECSNPVCPKLLCDTDMRANTTSFKFVGGQRTCFSCGEQVTQRKRCGARKLMQFDSMNEKLSVYHLGKHTCSLKRNKSDEYLKEVVESNKQGLCAKSLQKSQVMEALLSNDPSKARNVARKLVDRERISQMIRQGGKKALDQNSLEAVGILREQTKQVGRSYIYRINDARHNDNPDFVFLGSEVMAEIAIKMDTDGPDTQWNQEPCYIDGMHSRCQEFMSIGLWVKHPAMNQVLRLANMYCKTEDTKCLTQFYQVFNDLLRDVKGDPDYKFNPCKFMGDQFGGNQNAVENVFGKDICSRKCIGCQLHFKKDVMKHKTDVQPAHQKLYIDLCKSLVKDCHSAQKYKEVMTQLMDLAAENPRIIHFLQWWDLRRYHIVPAFRGYGYSGLNLAEVGNWSWKPSQKLRLVDACKDDVTSMVLQEEELKAFNEGKIRGRGKAPNQVSQMIRDRKRQIQRASAIGLNLSQLISTRDIDAALEEKECTEEGRTSFFRPASHARHKAPKKGIQGKMAPIFRESSSTGREETYTRVPVSQSPDSPPIDDTAPVVTSTPRQNKGSARGRGAGRGRGRGRGARVTPASQSSNADNSIDLARQIAAAPRSRNEDLPTHIGPLGGAPAAKKPQLVLIRSQRIVRCWGCHDAIDASLAEPYDMLFKRVGPRSFKHPTTGVQTIRTGPMYFHLQTSCLRNFDHTINIQDIFMDERDFQAAGRDRLKVLHNLGYLDIILKNQTS